MGSHLLPAIVNVLGPISKPELILEVITELILVPEQGRLTVTCKILPLEQPLELREQDSWLGLPPSLSPSTWELSMKRVHEGAPHHQLLL